MEQSEQNDKEKFLYPYASYHGQVNPENLILNANLQEFAQKVANITALETSGKISPNEAYMNIKVLWEQLKNIKKTLNVDDEPPTQS
jgi:hypothetical protein